MSAAPSFAFGFVMEPKPQRFLGMVLGVLFFIAFYTIAARWTFPGEGELPLWRRAIRLGTWIRATSSLLVWVGLLLSFWLKHNPLLFLFAPDFYAGFLAHCTAEKLTEIASGSAVGLEPGGNLAFSFLVTVIDGFLLSALLFLIAFCCLWVLTFRARRAAKLASAAAPCESSSQSPTA